MYTLIVDYNASNRVKKSKDGFDVEQAAIDEMDIGRFPKSFVTVQPQGLAHHWLVDPVAKTISYDPISKPTPPTDAEIAEEKMINDPLQRALIKRKARELNITPRQLMTEIMADA